VKKRNYFILKRVYRAICIVVVNGTANLFEVLIPDV